MADRLRGPVRFRFLHRATRDEPAVEVTLEGDAGWVGSTRAALELDEVGWVQPMAVSAPAAPTAPLVVGEDGELVAEEGPPGPPPDPSRVPIVRRLIGSLDMDAELARLRWRDPTAPTVAELAEAMEKEGPPVAIPGATTSDPMAEAWLRLLLGVAVRHHGVTALSYEMIEEAIGEQVEREGAGLEAWLDELFRQQKLVRVHGGTRVGYGPQPMWLDLKPRSDPDAEDEDDEEDADGAPREQAADGGSQGAEVTSA